MSIVWIPPIIGLLFVVIWLISFQAILAERGGTGNLSPRPTPPASDQSQSSTIRPRLD